MKIRMLGHKSCACYIFVVTLTLSGAVAVTTGSQIANLQSDSTDGQAESLVSTTTSPVATTVADFSSRQGVNGFKPSFDYARFAEQRSASNQNSSKVKFSAGEEARTKKHTRGQKIPPAALKLYDSHRDQYNSSSTDQVQKEESLRKLPTLYYGDVSHSKQSPLHENTQINNIEVDLKDHHPHHHENHNYEGGKVGIEEHPKYYFPKTLLGKEEPQDHAVDHGHGHHHEHSIDHGHGHHHPVDDVKVNYGHSHGYGYGYPEHHDHHDHHHDHHDHHHGHHHHTHSFGHSLKHSDHHKGHGLEGAIGKAFHLLIPSALFLGGVSALFPNRVHVPTTDNKYRQKRAISYQAGSSDPSDFEDIPAKYLKREHRSDDDGGIELDLDDGDNPFPFPNIRPPLSPSRDGHRNYNARLTPHQRFELSPPTTQRTPIGLRHRHRQNNRGMPEQYDAFFFNNPASYNFDIPPPTFSPDNEPSPIPPTFPTNRLQPTEEMVSEEELAPPQERTTTTTTTMPTTRKPKTKKTKNRNTLGAGHFVPIPIEEPVLDVIQDTTTETDGEELETTTRSPIVNKDKSSNNSTNTRDREARIQDEIINPLQTLNMISPNQISDDDEKAKTKNVDLSPDGPVIGLLSSYAAHDKDSPECQKKALCQLAMKGASPVATKFESFLWNLANLVPDQFSQLYDLEEIFNSIKKKNCNTFLCDNPNLDIQM